MLATPTGKCGLKLDSDPAENTPFDFSSHDNQWHPTRDAPAEEKI